MQSENYSCMLVPSEKLGLFLQREKKKKPTLALFLKIDLGRQS